MLQGLHQADSVLGTLHLEDGGSEIDAEDNLRSLQSTHSANGLQLQNQDIAAVLQAPSCQASIIPTESAYGQSTQLVTSISSSSDTGFVA